MLFWNEISVGSPWIFGSQFFRRCTWRGCSPEIALESIAIRFSLFINPYNLLFFSLDQKCFFFGKCRKSQKKLLESKGIQESKEKIQYKKSWVIKKFQYHGSKCRRKKRSRIPGINSSELKESRFPRSLKNPEFSRSRENTDILWFSEHSDE